MENGSWKQLHNWIIGLGCVVTINGFNFWNKEHEYVSRTGNSLAYALQWVGFALGVAGVALVLIGIELKKAKEASSKAHRDIRNNSEHLQIIDARLEKFLEGSESKFSIAEDELSVVSPRRNLSLPDIDLSGQDFSGAILRGADFSGSDLSETNFAEADLSGADLEDSDLSGANLSGANLNGADLTNANLTGANLNGADLTNANLTNADLTDADLIGAKMEKTDLTSADLTDADLIGANLKNADLTSADLERTNLTGAYLRGAWFSDVDLADTNFEKADLWGAHDFPIKGPTVEKGIASLTGARMPDGSFLD